MFKGLRSVLGIMLMTALSSCVVSQHEFYENKQNLSVETLCKTLDTSPDPAFRNQLIFEISVRGYSTNQCPSIVAAHDQAVASGILAAVVVGGAIAVCASGGCGGAGYPSPSVDPDWDYFWWQGQYVRRCRDHNSGQFLTDDQCWASPSYDHF